MSDYITHFTIPDDAGGYDVYNIDAYEQRYRCSVCKKLFREPVQMTCGDRFCSSCAISVIG
ncbi:unnamed protein product, partial [Didymodactylos carnosus]